MTEKASLDSRCALRIGSIRVESTVLAVNSVKFEPHRHARLRMDWLKLVSSLLPARVQ